MMRSWWASSTPQARDVGLAALLTVVAQAELLLAEGVESPRPWHAIAFALTTSAVALRRRVPLLALAIGGVALTASELIGIVPDVVTPLLAVIVLVYSCASYASTRAALAGLGLVVAVILAVPLATGASVVAELGNLVIFASIWMLGVAVRVRERRAVAAEAAVAEARAQARAAQDQAVRDERLRIARELHDVVAHGVTGMVLHAGAARQALAVEPDAARASMLEVERSGRQALEELRTMLTVMRIEDGVALDLVGEALARARDAGLAVEARLDWSPESAEPRVVTAVGRIVREAVTNVIRHAHGATRIEVAVHDDGTRVTAVVEDDGHAVAAGEPGWGLLGMRERAAELGGSLTTGPAPSGGWRVAVTVPSGDAR